MQKPLRLLAIGLGIALFAAASARPAEAPAGPAAVVAAPDRRDADRALDAGRQPAEMLAFFGIRSGWGPTARA
jgi:predicted methyltransferase